MMDVKADLREAKRFSEYDKKSNTFKVHSNMVSAADIGTYMIVIHARFFSDSYEENYTGKFFLNVW